MSVSAELAQDVVLQGSAEQDHVGFGARFLLRTMNSHTIHEITQINNDTYTLDNNINLTPELLFKHYKGVNP